MASLGAYCPFLSASLSGRSQRPPIYLNCIGWSTVGWIWAHVVAISSLSPAFICSSCPPAPRERKLCSQALSGGGLAQDHEREEKYETEGKLVCVVKREEDVGHVVAANYLYVSLTPREIRARHHGGPSLCKAKIRQKKHRRKCVCCQVGLNSSLHADGTVSSSTYWIFS